MDHQFTPLVIDWQVAKAIENLEGIIIMALQSRSKNTNFSNLYYDLSTFDYESQKKKRMATYLMTYGTIFSIF